MFKAGVIAGLECIIVKVFPDFVTYYKQAFDTSDSIHKVYLRMNAQVGIDRHNLDITEQAFQQTQKTSQRKTWLIAFLIVVVLIVLAGCYLLWRRHKQKVSENDKLHTEIDSISTRHSEEMQSTLDDLNERNRKLAAMVLYMEQMDDVVAQVKQIASSKSLTKTEAISKIQNLMLDVKIKNHSWEIFKKYFEETNPHFLEKLYKVSRPHQRQDSHGRLHAYEYAEQHYRRHDQPHGAHCRHHPLYGAPEARHHWQQ